MPQRYQMNLSLAAQASASSTYPGEIAMSCNIRIPIQQIIDDVAAALSGRYISTDNPFLNEAVLTDTTLRGDVTADTEARNALCGILQTCGVTAEELEWLSRPTSGDQLAFSSVVDGELVASWRSVTELLASYGFSQEYNTKKTYRNYAGMVADKDKLQSGAVIDIYGDTDPELNGSYTYNGVSFTKSPYDPVTAAGEYTDTAIDALKSEGGPLLDTYITAAAKFGGVSRTQAEKNLDMVSVTDLGVVGGGLVNNDAALTFAMNSGVPLYLPDDDFLYTQVVVDQPLRMYGPGRLKYSGEAGANGTATLIFNSSVVAESLQIETLGTSDQIYDLATFNASDVAIGSIKATSTNQRNQTGGMTFYGGNVHIDKAIFVNVARPLQFTSAAGESGETAWRKNVHVGKLVVDKYIRGLKYRYVDGLSIGEVYMSGLWAGATLTPGYNGILNESIRNAAFGTIYIADSIEHGFRFGCPEGSDTFHIDSITTKDTGSCGVKINPVSGQLVKNGKINSITVINAGRGSSLGNTESVRLTAIDGLEIGSITGLTRCTRGMLLADVKNLRVGSLYCENVIARAIEFNTGSDGSTGNCSDIRFESVVAKCSASARHAISATYKDGQSISNLRINSMYATGHNNTAVNLTDADISDSVINIRVAPTDSAVVFEGVTGKDVYTRTERNKRVYTGMAENLNLTAYTVQGGASLDPTTNNSEAPFLVSSMASEAGVNSYGSWFGFGRIASSRRAAAIAVKQTGSSTSQSGLAFFTQSTTTASDAITETMLLKHTGTVNLPILPKSATGLATGDLWNDAGTIKIV